MSMTSMHSPPVPSPRAQKSPCPWPICSGAIDMASSKIRLVIAGPSPLTFGMSARRTCNRRCRRWARNHDLAKHWPLVCICGSLPPRDERFAGEPHPCAAGGQNGTVEQKAEFLHCSRSKIRGCPRGSHDFRHGYNKHGGWYENKLRKQRSSQPAADEPNDCASKIRLRRSPFDYVVSHYRHLGIDEHKHQDRRRAIYNCRQGAGSYPKRRVQVPRVQRGKDSRSPESDRGHDCAAARSRTCEYRRDSESNKSVGENRC